MDPVTIGLIVANVVSVILHAYHIKTSKSTTKTLEEVTSAIVKSL